jgi:hypothetical protein
MAYNPKFSTGAVVAACSAITVLLNAGVLRIYSGGQPGSANAAVTAGNVALSSHNFAATAFGASVAGVASAGAITDCSAAFSGTATWFRALQTGGLVAVWDGSVATTGTLADLNLNSIAISADALVSITALTFTVNAG